MQPISTSVDSLVKDAMRDLGCLRAGMTPSTDQLNEGQRAINQLAEMWLLDELMVYTTSIATYTLVAGTQNYIIGEGSGAAFSAPRPIRIEYANLVLNNVTPNVRLPIELISDQQWADVRVRGISNALPTKLYYDGGFSTTTGNAIIALWPPPNAAYLLELFTWQQLTGQLNLSTGYLFPPGYTLAFRKGLACQLAPMMAIYQKIPQVLLDRLEYQYREALVAIRNYNAAAPIMYGDPAFMGTSQRGVWNYGIGESGKRGR